MANEPAYRDELVTLYRGDVLDVLRALPAGGIDALVTDPPAGIAFMGREWDTFPVRRRPAGTTFADGRVRPGITAGQEHRASSRQVFIAWLAEVMAECRRLLKPGAHALVWALPRTSHWTATAIEDAGLEVRDVVHHLFAQGFPKSLDVAASIGRRDGDAMAWAGWGTALKPSAEHWILARKPLAEPNVAAQVLATGTGAINVDGCRVATTELLSQGSRRPGDNFDDDGYVWPGAPGQQHSAGRWPANLVLSHAEGCRPTGLRWVTTGTAVRHRGVAGGQVYSRARWRHHPGTPDMGYADADGREAVQAWECVEGCPVGELDGRSHASRFFFVAKAGTADRSAGLVGERNRHPTVKSVELMRWLVRLVTPPGGIVLDCFAGSGSTLVAAKLEGLRSIGIERDPEAEHVCIRRLGWAVHQPSLLDGEDRPEPAGGEAVAR